MMNGYGFNWFGMGFGGLTMLLFWGLIIGLVVWAFLAIAGRNQSQHGASRDRSLDILRERYARGEINKDEFERMRQDLNG